MSSQIHDLGYRAYTGERAGVGWAIRSLAIHSIRRALGLKRSGRHKIAPIIAIAMAFLPAVIAAGIAAFLGGEIASDLIGYGEYFGWSIGAMVLFTAAVAPGVVTTDRTTGMLPLYFASPLTRTTYVLAKAIGIFIVMLIVTMGPILFLTLAYVLADSGPGGFGAFLELMVRTFGASVLAALLFTGIGLFLSSIPRRWGLASLLIIGGVFIPGVVSAILTEGADASDWFGLIAPIEVMAESWSIILDDRTFSNPALDSRSASVVVVVSMLFPAALLALSWWRYQTIEVER